MSQERALSLREQLLVDLLPGCNWSITEAGLAAGFSRSYAETALHSRCKRDVSLHKAIAAKRREISEKSWSVEQWRTLVADLLADCKARGDRTNAKELLRLIGQHIGAFEADNRQRGPSLNMLIM
jgi:hypothetical protein